MTVILRQLLYQYYDSLLIRIRILGSRLITIITIIIYIFLSRHRIVTSEADAEMCNVVSYSCKYSFVSSMQDHYKLTYSSLCMPTHSWRQEQDKCSITKGSASRRHTYCFFDIEKIVDSFDRKLFLRLPPWSLLTHLLPLETSADLLFRLQDGHVYTVLRRPTSEGTSAHVKDVADDLATQLTATAEGIKAKIGDYNWMLKTISEEERVLKDKAKETLSDLSHIFKITILFNVK